MEFLLNPNIAYLLLVTGSIMTILSLLSPGTGVIEVGALFTLLLAGYAIYNLPVNTWALGVLFVGVFPFLLAVRKSGQMRYLVMSILALVIGSAFLFRSQGWQPAVNPILVVLVSTVVTGFLWTLVRKSLEASLAVPAQDLSRLIGATGAAETDIHEVGTVQVAGELWTARSRQPIPVESTIRVVAREGFTLEVELVHKRQEVKAQPQAQAE